MTAVFPREIASALASLDALDAHFDARFEGLGVARRTLAPDRATASRFATIAAVLFRREPPRQAATAEAFAVAIERIAHAVAANFPENLFWDFDYLAASLWRAANRESVRSGERDLAVTADLVVELDELFGANRDIRFRYTHDFAYGFDWAKWVAREPSSRADVGPFDARFLRALRDRAFELLELIAQDDSKYGRLEGCAPRNPFGFRRDPVSEALLHQDLAAAHALPLEAWSIDACPVWNRPFATIRETHARALGLTVGLTAAP